MTAKAGAWRYRVTNTTRQTVLGQRVVLATRFFSRLRGLMGRPALTLGEGLVLEPCNGIHTFFMQAPIDALFLDAQGRVRHRYATLNPWRLTPIHFGIRSVLELPEGTIHASRTETGDVLLFEKVGAAETLC